MAPKRNLYATLGILRTCSDVEIRAAYKRRALETHPDKGGSHNSFLQVIQAFTALSDPVERAKYDANLKLRRDSDGTTLPPAAQPAAQAPAERCPRARKPAGPSSPAKPPKKVPTKRSPEASASPAPEAPASEAKAIWQRWLDAPEEEWEEKFRSITYRMSSKVLEIGKLSFKISKPGEAPKRKPGRKRVRSILDVPHKNSKTRGMQKHIRKVGSDNFHCIMCFRNLEVATSSSRSLEEAIDWHICLTRFQQMMEKTLDQGGDKILILKFPKLCNQFSKTILIKEAPLPISPSAYEFTSNMSRIVSMDPVKPIVSAGSFGHPIWCGCYRRIKRFVACSSKVTAMLPWKQ